MKGNVFSIWLKEFCALVFTQTVQAFILAIILTIIVMTYQRQGVSGLSQYVQTQATGVLAIIALTSISKMESLVKKIFGLESSVTDTSMKGGRGSILGSIAAMKMAKNVLNNAPKVAKGVKGRFAAGKEARQAKIDAHDRLMKLDSRYGVNSGAANTAASPGASTNSAVATQANANVSGSGSGSAISSGSGANISSGNATQNSSSQMNDKYLDKKEKIMEDYNKRLADAKKAKREARKDILSGLTETAGATVGGTFGLATGAVVAAGTGDDILATATKGAGIGMGVGDKIGKGVADAAFSPRDIAKSVTGVLDTYSKENKKKMAKFEEELKKFNAGDI